MNSKLVLQFNTNTPNPTTVIQQRSAFFPSGPALLMPSPLYQDPALVMLELEAEMGVGMGFNGDGFNSGFGGGMAGNELAREERARELIDLETGNIGAAIEDERAAQEFQHGDFADGFQDEFQADMDRDFGSSNFENFDNTW